MGTLTAKQLQIPLYIESHDALCILKPFYQNQHSLFQEFVLE